MSNKNRLPLLAAGVLAIPVAQADEVAQLNEVTVIAREQAKSTGEIKKSRRVVQDELISDARDLVRYTTDVGISDAGRHNKGFAMRGVEGNRVGISIDGVSLPDSEENSLYARYGNFNSSRITIDPELVEGIDIMRGSDSFNSGSGSLGGTVSYRTLTASDILLPERKLGGLLKTAYASKNREWTYTSGIGYKDDKWEAVALYSHRHGHEMKSNGNGEDIYGDARGIPDPAKHRNHNYLAKLSYLFNDTHKLSVSYSGHRHKNMTDEKSYSFTGSSWREADDISERDNLNLAYEFFPLESKLAYGKLEYDYQKTLVGAINYKGGRNWTTNAKELGEVNDRRLYTKFHRMSGRLDSVPFEFLSGTHILTFKAGASHHDFKNDNYDYYPDQVIHSSIQHPVKTKQFYATLQDNVQWTDKLSSNMGIRYDYAKVSPQALNAACNACFKTIPSAVTFESLSANLGLDYQINDYWKTSYNLSSGYRTPSASEMFFTYEHPAGNWLANPKLKPERSIHQSISFQGESDKGNVMLHLYHTRYKDFLYEQETRGWRINEKCDAHCQFYGGKRVYETLFQQAVNFDKAKISGIELSGKLNLDTIASFIPQGWNAMGAIGYSKGKLSDGQVSLLSIQPIKAILGIGYDDPQDRWGLQTRWTYLGEKKGKDAQILTYYYDPRGQTRDYPYLNGSAVLFDTYGFVKVNKNITLRAGVYNLFDRKYHTWDSLRGINFRGTTNTVDREGKGLERFYAPGRNFAASVEVKF